MLYSHYAYGQEVFCCRFSTLNYFAVGIKNGDIYYYASPNTSVWNYTTTGGGSVFAVAFSQDGTILSSGWGTGGGNQNIFTTNPVSSNTHTLSFAGAKDFKGLDYSPDGFTLASGDKDGNLRIHLVSDGYRQVFNDTGLNSIN